MGGCACSLVPSFIRQWVVHLQAPTRLGDRNAVPHKQQSHWRPLSTQLKQFPFLMRSPYWCSMGTSRPEPALFCAHRTQLRATGTC